MQIGKAIQGAMNDQIHKELESAYLYLAMSAHHRIGFRAGDKEFLLRKGNRDTIAGTVAAALAFWIGSARPGIRSLTMSRARATMDFMRGTCCSTIPAAR